MSIEQTRRPAYNPKSRNEYREEDNRLKNRDTRQINNHSILHPPDADHDENERMTNKESQQVLSM